MALCVGVDVAGPSPLAKPHRDSGSVVSILDAAPIYALSTAFGSTSHSYKVWGLSLDRVECWVLKTFESLRSNATFSLNKLLASKGLESKSGTGIHVEVDVQLHKNAHCREAVANEAELLLPKLKVGALGVELLATEDLEHLRDVEQILPKRRRIRQAIVDKNKSAPFQRASSSWDPPVDQC